MNLSTNQPDLLIFAEILAYLPLEPGYLNAVTLKNPRPKLPVMVSTGEGLGNL